MRTKGSGEKNRRNLLRRLIFIVVVLSSVPAFARAQDARTEAWTRFRARFPYHMQTVALSRPEPDGRRVLIVSEPPPAVTFDAFRDAFGDRVSDLTIQTQRIGVDGWVKDIAGTIAIRDDAELSTLVSDVTRHLFGTSHKAYALEFDRSSPSTSTFDLSVSASDLMRVITPQRPQRSEVSGVLQMSAWLMAAIAGFVFFVRKRRRLAPLTIALASVAGGCWIGQPPALIASETGDFEAVHGERAGPLLDLINQQATGVFLSTKPGLVALIVPRRVSLNQSSVALREFAVDSDVIVGAIGSADTVAVLGRTRSVGVDALPPLRVETLLQLAATTESELGQSYERAFLLAGRYQEDPSRDWAPIYLSDALQDTEYGSLLNVTDQLLKSWSQHGEVHYANFTYPSPARYPFPGSLSNEVKVRRLTFNWNTKGVGYVASAPPYEVVAFSRLGALPVDYLGDLDASLKSAEDTAYEYFATIRDPNLARVVQYAGIYQIWRHFGVPAAFAPSTRERHGADALTPFVSFVLQRLAGVDLDELRAMAPAEDKALVDEFAGIHKRLTEAVAEHGLVFLDDLAAVIVSPRVYRPNLGDKGRTIEALATDLQRSMFVRILLHRRLPTARAIYQKAESEFDPTGWIKTPSIVESWTDGSSMNLVGGHNVDSVISSLRADASLAKGDVRVLEEQGQRVLLHSPLDADGIHSTVRTFGRNQKASASELGDLVRTTLPQVVEARFLHTALNLGTRDASDAIGLGAKHVDLLASARGWRLGDAIPTAHTAVLDQLSDASVLPVVVERQQGKYLISHGGRREVMEAGDSASALDAVFAGFRDADPAKVFHVHFKNVEVDQARGFAHSLDLQGGPRQTRLRTSVEDGGAGSVKLLGELQRGRWNPAGAKVRIVDGADGRLTKQINAEVQRMDVGIGREITMKVKFIFTEAVARTAETFARLTEAIERFIVAAAALPDKVDVMLASRRLMRELKAIDPTISHVDIRLADDNLDITVVEHIGATVAAYGE